MPLKPQLGGVGYICRKFPVLSETFITNQITGLIDPAQFGFSESA